MKIFWEKIINRCYEETHQCILTENLAFFFRKEWKLLKKCASHTVFMYFLVAIYMNNVLVSFHSSSMRGQFSYVAKVHTNSIQFEYVSHINSLWHFSMLSSWWHWVHYKTGNQLLSFVYHHMPSMQMSKLIYLCSFSSVNPCISSTILSVE